MAVHYRTLGIILKKTDRGEADQVLTVYTKDFGKLEILGRAIRKISSKLRSGADLFYLSEIEFIQGKAYKTLTDAISIEKFKGIRNDLEKTKIAYRIADTLDNLIRGQEKEEAIFNLLNETFSKLDNCQLPPKESPRDPTGQAIANCELVYHYFLWNLFSFLGYEIDFYYCVVCQKKLSPLNLYFSVEEGGIVCGGCLGKAAKCGVISADIIKIIRLFLKKDWKTLSKIKIEKTYLDSLSLISESCLSYYKKTE